MDFIRYMITKYTLSPLEKDILIYILGHIDEDGKLPIREVSRDTYTSTTTIFNLAKKMGFSGYTELLYAVKTNMYNEQLSENAEKAATQDVQHPSMINCKLFHEMLDKHKNDNIFTFGSGLSEIVSKYIHDKLLLEGYQTLHTTLLEVLYTKENKDCLLIFVSESGTNFRVIEMIENANAIGLDTICLTANPNAEILSQVTLPIIMPHSMIKTHHRSLAPKMMLYFDDLLYKDVEFLLQHK